MIEAARLPARRRLPPVHPDPGGKRKPGITTQALQATAPALLLLAGALLPPDRPFPFDLCLWHRLTGLDCLGCGLTRSVCYVMHGDLARSLALHPAGVIVVAIAAVLALRGGREAVRIVDEAVRGVGGAMRGPGLRRRG